MAAKERIYYGWVVVFASFLSVTMFGVVSSYGTFVGPLESHLGASRTAISGVYTIELFFYAVFAPLMGWLSDRSGPRIALWLSGLLLGGGMIACHSVTSLWQLYLFFGVIAGIGHSAIFVVPTTTAAKWFTKRRGLAVGITACGLGFGLLLLPPISAYLIRVYSWQTAFIFLGTLAFTVNLLVGSVIGRKPEEYGAQPHPAGRNPAPAPTPPVQGHPLLEILRARAFWVVYFTAVFCYGAEQMLVVHLVPYCATIGITTAQASLGLSCLGMGTIAGRFVMGWLSDRIGGVPTLIMSCALQSVTTFGLLAISGPWVLYPVMLAVGFGYGGWAVMAVVVLGEFLGVKNLGKSVGLYMTNGVLAGLMGPFLAGAIFDATHSYFFAIIVAGVTCAIPCLLAASLLGRRPAPAG